MSVVGRKTLNTFRSFFLGGGGGGVGVVRVWCT